MTFETVMNIVFVVFVAFLLFGAPWLAEKQAKATLAKWDREDAQAASKGRR